VVVIVFVAIIIVVAVVSFVSWMLSQWQLLLQSILKMPTSDLLTQHDTRYCSNNNYTRL